MARPARLITPQGQTIDLPDEVNRKVSDLPADQPQPQDLRSINEASAAGYGKYAEGASLTKALLVERASKHARKEARLARQPAKDNPPHTVYN